MRKKSHISLAKLLIDNMQVQALNEHRAAFYIGSILPDIKPSFLTKRHSIEETFDILAKEIKKITVEYDINKGISSYYARHLGVITHYLADYCTFPHNTLFQGTMSQHIYYEKELKFVLKDYVRLKEAQIDCRNHLSFPSIEELSQFILKTHEEYLKAKRAVKIDIHYAVELCHRVVVAILKFLEQALLNLKRSVDNNSKLHMDCV